MKLRTTACLFLLSGSIHAVPVFIGTNTGGDSGSKGIYLADFDATTGRLSKPKLAVEYQNPGFLALHPTKPILYACGVAKKPIDGKPGSVAAFGISGDYTLSFLGEASSRGENGCHIAVDATGSALTVANYGDGMVASIKLDENGLPGEAATEILTPGSGPTPRQKGPHAHGVYFDQSNRFLFEPDLGADKVYVYQFDVGSSKFSPAKQHLETAAGAGPRHMAFSPDEKHAYVINELDNTILAASYDGNGGFKTIGTVSTLPADYKEASSTAEIEVSPDGRFVYASNRGHDSLVVFSRDVKSGALTYVQHAPCGGKTPRHFKIAPGGKWLLCGHQNSNTISVLPIDPESGKLGEAASTVDSPSPICILFAR